MITQIKEVKTRKDLRAFVHFPNQLYKDNLYYVPQIESMERDTLTPEKNHAFEVCEGKYWLAYNERGEVVGRVAGIINRKYNEKTGQKTCRFGWIDFIDDRNVSKTLLDTVEQYAKEKGYLLVVISNQAGIAKGRFDECDTHYSNKLLQERLGGIIDGFYYCPHHTSGKNNKGIIAENAKHDLIFHCDCRKPEIGMFVQCEEDLKNGKLQYIDEDLISEKVSYEKDRSKICAGNPIRL